MLPRHLEYIVKPVDVHIPSELGVLLAGRGQDCRQMENGVNIVLSHHLLNRLPLRDIDKVERSGLQEFPARLGLSAGGDHIFRPVPLTECQRQLRADLTDRTGHQYFPHWPGLTHQLTPFFDFPAEDINIKFLQCKSGQTVRKLLY